MAKFKFVPRPEVKTVLPLAGKKVYRNRRLKKFFYCSLALNVLFILAIAMYSLGWLY